VLLVATSFKYIFDSVYNIVETDTYFGAKFNFAKVGVEGSNPFTRSRFQVSLNVLMRNQMR
jgi:hypothetical protein